MEHPRGSIRPRKMFWFSPHPARPAWRALRPRPASPFLERRSDSVLVVQVGTHRRPANRYRKEQIKTILAFSLVLLCGVGGGGSRLARLWMGIAPCLLSPPRFPWRPADQQTNEANLSYFGSPGFSDLDSFIMLETASEPSPQHMYTYTLQEPLKCPECGELYGSFSALVNSQTLVYRFFMFHEESMCCSTYPKPLSTTSPIHYQWQDGRRRSLG